MRNQEIPKFSQLCQGETKISVSVGSSKFTIDPCVLLQCYRGMSVTFCGYRSFLQKEGMLRWQSCPYTPSCTGSVLTLTKGLGEETHQWETEEWEWGALDVFSCTWAGTFSPGCLCLVTGLVWVVNSCRLGEERRLTAFCAVPAARSALVRSQHHISYCPQRKKKLHLLTLFSILLPTSAFK